MKKLSLILFLLASSGGSLFAQDFIQNYSFVNTGTRGPGTSFANTGVSSFFMSWSPQTSMNTCSIQADSSSDGSSWGSGDLIASQSCTTAGSATVATLGNGKNFVRVNVTVMSGNGGLNVTLKGWGGGGGGITSVTPGAAGAVFNIKDPAYGAKGDAQMVKDGVTPGGAGKTVTSATANFVAGDVGKFINCNNTSGQIVTVGTKILTRNSATVVGIDTNDLGAASGLRCVWYTKKDDPAIRSAILAASPPAGSNDPNQAPTLGNSGTVYCPEGGYAVTVNAALGALMVFGGGGSGIGPNFVGAGKGKCNIYVLPDSTDAGGPEIFNLTQTSQSLMGGFSIDGLAFPFSWSHAIVGWNAVQHSRMYDVEITNISASFARGALDFTNSADIMVENVFVQGNSGSGANDFACGFYGVSSSHFKNLTCSNHNQTALFQTAGGQLRGVGGDNAPTFENATFDECGSATLDCTMFVAGYANFIGGWIGVGNTGRNAINLDATSKVWLTDVNCGQFGSTNVVTNCMSGASGAFAFVSGSTLRGNGSGANGAVATGPAGFNFIDVGGNEYYNCVSAVCTKITSATYATQGFINGVVPKATVTHTPNTCYAVTGNLLATAQNLCTFLNDQNYQVLNITAQSGGTTPAASACATPPVITFSDGTRTATLTMTTAKTQWNSSVDAVTNLNQVFATGTTLTISIGANTCATPPANVSVSYVLQSVLNP